MAKAHLLSGAVIATSDEQPIYVGGKRFIPDRSKDEENPLVRFEKDMWNWAQRH
jgi:hypothetical protein